MSTVTDALPMAHDKDDEAIRKVQFPIEVRKKIQDLQVRNNWYNFFAIGLDWGTVALAIAMYKLFPNAWVYLIGIIFIGGRMRGLDNLMHEASHVMLFKNRRLNKWMACIFAAFPIFTSYTTYCKSHFNHHKFLWSEKDPDAIRYKNSGLENPPREGFLLTHIFRPLTLVHVPRYVYGTFYVNLFSKDEPMTERIARIGFWVAIIASSIVFGFWQEVVMFWLIPWLTTFQIIRYWSEMAEHAGLKTSNALYSSRNSFGNIFERLLIQPHHDTYHLVHHLFPAVPHYNLKKVHMILMDVPEYREAHHCTGWFKAFAPGFFSVLDDITGNHVKKRFS